MILVPTGYSLRETATRETTTECNVDVVWELYFEPQLYFCGADMVEWEVGMIMCSRGCSCSQKCMQEWWGWGRDAEL